MIGRPLAADGAGAVRVLLLLSGLLQAFVLANAAECAEARRPKVLLDVVAPRGEILTYTRAYWFGNSLRVFFSYGMDDGPIDVTHRLIDATDGSTVEEWPRGVGGIPFPVFLENRGAKPLNTFTPGGGLFGLPLADGRVVLAEAVHQTWECPHHLSKSLKLFHPDGDLQWDVTLVRRLKTPEFVRPPICPDGREHAPVPISVVGINGGVEYSRRLSLFTEINIIRIVPQRSALVFSLEDFSPSQFPSPAMPHIYALQTSSVKKAVRQAFLDSDRNRTSPIEEIDKQLNALIAEHENRK